MTENDVIDRRTATPVRGGVALGTLWGAVAALVVNVTIWLVGHTGEPIRVVTGWAPDGADLTLIEVVATTLVAIGLGGVLLGWMQRHFDRFRAWSIIVASVAVASALPLWSLDVDTGSKFTLSCMHFATGACAIAAQFTARRAASVGAPTRWRH